MPLIAKLSVLVFAVGLSTEGVRPERCSYAEFGPWLSIPERVERAEYLFTGYALDRLPEPNGVTQSDTAVFIVENSWKGPHPDTVHVFIGHVCPQVVSRGATYIVAANVEGGVLRATRREGLLIDVGRETGYQRVALDSLQRLLGTPSWKAPPMRERAFLRREIPGSKADSGHLAVFIRGPVRGAGMSVALIGDTVIEPRRLTHYFDFKNVEVGRIYIVRVRLPDGERQEEYFVRPVCERSEFGCSDFLQIILGSKADPLPALADSAIILPGLRQAVATVTELSRTARTAPHLTVDITSIISVARVLGGGEVTLAAASGAALVIRPDAVDSEMVTSEHCIMRDICPAVDEVILSVDGATFTGDAMIVGVGICRRDGDRFASPVATWEVRLMRTPRGWVLSHAAIS